METGRVPHHQDAVVTPTPEIAPEPVFSPRHPVDFPIWFLNPPPFPEPPIVIPPGPPVCDPEEDPECEEEPPTEPPVEPPEEPPTDVPEPDALAILMSGGAIYWLLRRRRDRIAK